MRDSSARSHHSSPALPGVKRPRSTAPSDSRATIAASTSDSLHGACDATSATVVGPSKAEEEGPEAAEGEEVEGEEGAPAAEAAEEKPAAEAEGGGGDEKKGD